jgi:hypothetical protein
MAGPSFPSAGTMLRMTPDLDLADLPAADLVRRIAAGRATAREAVEASLARIDRHDRDVNAFSVVLADQARRPAPCEADPPPSSLRTHWKPVRPASFDSPSDATRTPPGAR